VNGVVNDLNVTRPIEQNLENTPVIVQSEPEIPFEDVIIEDVYVDENRLTKTLDQLSKFSDKFSIQRLDKSFCDVLGLIIKHKDDLNKNILLDDIDIYMKKNKK